MASSINATPYTVGVHPVKATLNANWATVKSEIEALQAGTGIVGPVSAASGGTGVANNAASTITIVGAFALALTLSAGTALTLPATGTLATLAGTEAFSNKTIGNTNTVTLKDTLFTLQDDGDATKQAQFQLSGLTTATTRTYTLPDASGTLLYSGGPLGTPASGILTSCTGLPISSGISGLGTGIATALAVNTGSAGAPILFNGNAGTPSALVGTNISGTASSLTAGTATNAVNSGITDDTATNASMFPVWVTANTGNLPLKVSSTTLFFNPSTGRLTLGAGTDATTLSPQFMINVAGIASFTVLDSTNHIELGMFTNASPAIAAFGTRTSNALWIQTNSSNKFAFHVSGGFSVGSTTDPGTNGFSVAGTTDSATTATGSIINSGGLGVAKAIFGGTTLNIAGVATLASGTATPAGGSTSARLLFGTTAGFGIYYGSGAPSVSAAQGSVYLRSDGSSTSTRLYVNTTGSTTWTNVTTAA